MTKLYPIALETGIRPDEFWQMSVAEITDTITSKHKAKEKDIRNANIRAYNAAVLCATAALSPSDLPSFEAAFYGTEDGQIDWRLQKANMAAWVQEHNKRVEQKGGGAGE